MYIKAVIEAKAISEDLMMTEYHAEGCAQVPLAINRFCKYFMPNFNTSDTCKLENKKPKRALQNVRNGCMFCN
jgi:hypothetical protein